MKVLVINTYGGSLLLGAKALGVEIIGSYEDTGFGLPIQQANFPDLEFRARRRDWPIQDLSETFVIAHPPCSAFSVQNSNPQARGVDSSAFACTKSVLQYAADNKALGIAIESVVGALAGAWDVHQYYADTYGYNLYRVLENGCMFGAQWRDRFWVIYTRKGATPNKIDLRLQPNWQTIRDVVGEMSGPSPFRMDEALEKMKRRFVEEAGCTPEDMEFIFGPQNVDDTCSVDDKLWRRKFPTEDRWEICKRYVTKYASGAMVHLNPEGLCPVLLGGSWWYMDGRNVSETAYKQLMGFPADYIFPEAGRYHQDMRTYLSKGVMPPIAEWILEQALGHLGWHSDVVRPQLTTEPYHLSIEPDGIADFRIRKKTWGQDHPPLRHEDPIERPRHVARVVAFAKPTPGAAEEAPKVKPPKPERVRIARTPRSKSPWNSPEIEDSLRETLFVRPNTADAYALYESHGYHRMGIKAGDILLDLGAHIGCVASRAALMEAAKIISIEAEPENYELLQQNTRSFQNVITLHGAVFGGTEPEVQLHRVNRRNESAHSTGTHSCFYTTKGDTIAVRRLDFRELLEEHQPTVIKCDIEGSEFTLDWTNLPACVRSIGVELHTRRDTNRDKAKELIATLEAQGFKPVHNLNLESNFSAIIAFLRRDSGVTESTSDRVGESTVPIAGPRLEVL